MAYNEVPFFTTTQLFFVFVVVVFFFNLVWLCWTLGGFAVPKMASAGYKKWDKTLCIVVYSPYNWLSQIWFQNVWHGGIVFVYYRNASSDLLFLITIFFPVVSFNDRIFETAIKPKKLFQVIESYLKIICMRVACIFLYSIYHKVFMWV